MASDRLIEALATTAEICNARWSDPTKLAVVKMLEKYPEHAVLRALERCCLELRHLSLADIIARIDDGRPGVEEAWAMLPKSEADTVVWTDEMAEAAGVARQLEDPTAARMAFKEKYLALVADARRSRKPTRWIPSLGTDLRAREAAIREAVDRKRLTPSQAADLLPNALPAPGGLLQIGTDVKDEGSNVAEKARELARHILKDAPVQIQAAEALRQKRTQAQQVEHEARVLKQLEQLKAQTPPEEGSSGENRTDDQPTKEEESHGNEEQESQG